MKTLAAALGAGFIAAAMLAAPAQARCIRHGHMGYCARTHRADVRVDRVRVHRMRARVRDDRRHLREVQTLLRRDINGAGSGSSMQFRRDSSAVRRAQRDLLGDHRALRDARQQLREDRMGY